jgi:hypothetical protein
MPGFDRTGPRGEGPMTGRRQGYCAGEPQGFDQAQGRPLFGRRDRRPRLGLGWRRGSGRGRGRGIGRGRGRRFARW